MKWNPSSGVGLFDMWEGDFSLRAELRPPSSSSYPVDDLCEQASGEESNGCWPVWQFLTNIILHAFVVKAKEGMFHTRTHVQTNERQWLGGYIRAYIRRKKGGHHTPVKHGGGSMMRWGCSAAGTGALHKIDSIMTKEHDMEILKQHFKTKTWVQMSHPKGRGP